MPLAFAQQVLYELKILVINIPVPVCGQEKADDEARSVAARRPNTTTAHTRSSPLDLRAGMLRELLAKARVIPVLLGRRAQSRAIQGQYLPLRLSWDAFAS